MFSLSHRLFWRAAEDNSWGSKIFITSRFRLWLVYLPQYILVISIVSDIILHQSLSILQLATEVHERVCSDAILSVEIQKGANSLNKNKEYMHRCFSGSQQTMLIVCSLFSKVPALIKQWLYDVHVKFD